jgi:hypothetical protein
MPICALQVLARERLSWNGLVTNCPLTTVQRYAATPVIITYFINSGLKPVEEQLVVVEVEDVFKGFTHILQRC